MASDYGAEEADASQGKVSRHLCLPDRNYAYFLQPFSPSSLSRLSTLTSLGQVQLNDTAEARAKQPVKNEVETSSRADIALLREIHFYYIDIINALKNMSTTADPVGKKAKVNLKYVLVSS